MIAMGVAPSALRDIERIYTELRKLVREGKAPQSYPDRWFEEVDAGIKGLRRFARRHPSAPEREEWGREVRNVLLPNGYRILYEMRGDTVWVMRVRHQSRKQLRAAGPGSAFRPDLVVS